MVDTLQGSLSIEAKQFYERDMLYVAKQAQVFYDLGKKSKLPKNSGTQVSWRRLNAFNLATSPITEAATPTADSITMNEVTANASQYGNYIVYSDQANDLAIDKIASETNTRMGQNAGESIDAIIRNVIQAGTNVLYATGSSRSAVGIGNPLTLNLIRRGKAQLGGLNAKPYMGGMEQDSKIGNGTWVQVIHPTQEYDLFNDPEIKNAFQYGGNNDSQWTGKLGTIYGVEIWKSTLCPIFVGQGSGGANVYGNIMFGAEAFGVVDVAGRGKYELIEKPIGSAGTSDPLNQRGSIGWRTYQCPVVLNNNFMLRIEVGNTLG